MTAHVRRLIVSLLAAGGLFSVTAPLVQASCGAVSCFVVIGSQQQVPMAGLLTVNAIYNYTPSWTPAGQGGNIPFADQENRTLTLANLNSSQIWTHVATGTLDMNYGVTDRFGLQVTLPYKRVNSEANLGTAEPTPYTNVGMGDMRVTMKYNVLPTLRSMVVLGLGVDFPTGTYQERASTGQMVESTLQLGRGGFNLVPLEQTQWLVLTQQVNYRWMQNDAMDASLFQFNPNGAPILLDPTVKFRSVPTTGSTFVAYSPGIRVTLWDFASAYAVVQIPVYRDFNGNLEQQISYVFGLTKSFQLFGGS
jgi:hypothetical protein